MNGRLVLALVCAGAPLLAQNTWIVDTGGGPGVHFSDLPTAVASPNVVDGDTIVVQWYPPVVGPIAFTTNKGITIVSVPAGPMFTQPGHAIEVNGLPAGRKFRMAHFHQMFPGELCIRVVNCAGEVHFENMRVNHLSPTVLPTGPSILVDNSASVTLRGVETYGAPAVLCNASTLSMVSCRLGDVPAALGPVGPQALLATNSVVEIVQPSFHAGPAAGSIVSTNSALRIAGDTTSLIDGGSGSAIATTGGTVVVDPAVAMPGSGPSIGGTAAVTVGSVPASWTLANATFGQVLSIQSTAAPGALLFQALGAPGALTSTPLGTLGIDVLQAYAFFPAAVVTNTGVVTNTVPMPALPLGTAFATQPVVWNGALLQFGLPCTFVVQ